MSNEKNSKNLIILGVVVVLFVVGIFLTKNGGLNSKALSAVDAKAKVEKFIKEELLTDGTQFTIGEATKYNNGLYQMDITIADSKEPIKTYVSTDGKLFFPQAMEIKEASSTPAAGDQGANDAQQPTAQAPKSDKPVVELFVMSHCPFGTQIEKGMIPVVEALKGKIDFKLKFVDYAMHGDKELKEQLRQYCIDKEQNGAMLPYLKCFLKDGNGDACLDAAKVDKKKLEACYNNTDKQFKVMETFAKGESAWGGQFPPFNIFKADNDKYGVQGSPTLVINGQEISAGRDSASLAKTICGAFNDGKKPAECDKEFSSAAPAPGFGEGTTNSNTNASCN